LAVDGYFRILGRVDDVINVAGHRLGTKEIESACLTVPEVAEAAVVPVVDEIKGRVPEVYIVVQPDVLPTQHEEILAKVSGMTGLGDSGMSMIVMLLTGVVVDKFSYLPVFIAAGVFPLVSLTALLALVGTIRPVRLN